MIGSCWRSNMQRKKTLISNRLLTSHIRRLWMEWSSHLGWLSTLNIWWTLQQESMLDWKSSIADVVIMFGFLKDGIRHLWKRQNTLLLRRLRLRSALTKRVSLLAILFTNAERAVVERNSVSIKFPITAFCADLNTVSNTLVLKTTSTFVPFAMKAKNKSLKIFT